MDPFIGQIMQIGFSFAPSGWAYCQGQQLPISQNQALFSLLGVTFGGNGQTVFNLPDLRGRFIVGTGTGGTVGTYNAAQTGGLAATPIAVNQLPPHTHAIAVSQTAPAVSATLQAIPNTATTTGAPAAGSLLSTVSDTAGGGAPQIYAPAGSTGTAVNLGGLSATVTPGNVTATAGMTGSGLPIPTLPPYIGISSIIALQGIYPTRP